MYNLLVWHQFREGDVGTFRFDKSRFLEYTTESLVKELQPLSNEAIECIQSWPCLLMDEGRAEQLVRVVRISEFRDLGKEIRLTVNLCPSKSPIMNDHLWRIRGKLDIEQFEFSRYHWAIKERDLFSVLNAAGHEFNSSDIDRFEARPLPTPIRASLIQARNSISEWSHDKIDDLLLEAGVHGLSAGRAVGSRRARADSIVQYSIENPSTVTAENSLFSAFLVRRTAAMERRAQETVPPPPTREVASVTVAGSETNSADRSPNRVFVVHGQNDTARAAVVSFLERMGLVAVVLNEQPNMGRHLLTKFIREAELVTFAVVLMTDDDVGSMKGGKLAPRTRQNVILELGYFLAHLGQEKVCALITPGLETPSDFDGIVYIRMDDERRWQRELKRELLAARMPIAEVSRSSSAG